MEKHVKSLNFFANLISFVIIGAVCFLTCKQILAQDEGTNLNAQKIAEQEMIENLVYHLNETGVLFLEGEKLRIAKSFFKLAIKLDPKFAKSYLNKGIVFAMKSRIQKALIDFNKAIRLDSTSAGAFNNRGMIFSQSGQNRKAIKDFDRALELDQLTPSVETFYNRGIAWNNLREYDKAIEDFNRVILLDPYFAESYNARGVAWVLKKEYDKAIEDFKKALKLDPDMAYEAEYNAKLALEAKEGKQVKKSYRIKQKVVKRKKLKSFLMH